MEEFKDLIPEECYGERIEDRNTQIIFSALGQDAPLDRKKSWDPTTEKRRKMVDVLSSLLPNYSVTFAGTTSIDVTLKGINKAYGVRQMMKYFDVSVSDVVFIGDALMPGGNDAPVIETGVDCIAVENSVVTEKLIEKFLNI